MASPQVQAAWREAYKARKKHVAVPESARRILNEYRRPGSREYQRQKRASYREVPPGLFEALRDRGIPSVLINRHSHHLTPLGRYLIVGTVVKNRRKILAIMYTNTKSAVISAVSAVPYPAVVIDTKEIH